MKNKKLRKLLKYFDPKKNIFIQTEENWYQEIDCINDGKNMILIKLKKSKLSLR